MLPEHIQTFLAHPDAYLSERAQWYAANPYLKHVHPEGLIQREQDLLGNLWTTDDVAAVARIYEPGRREFMFTRLVDLNQEKHRRGERDQSVSIDEAELRAAAAATYRPPRLAEPLPELMPGGLVRFSKRGFLEETLRRGRLRIAPAAIYADSSLNAAQIDDELRHRTVTPHEHLMVRMWGSETLGGPEKEIAHKPLELFRYMHVRPFYVLCLSDRFNFRMFHDFEADAALLIHAGAEFQRRLQAAVAAQLEADCAIAPVYYYDPYTIRRKGLVPGFSKHFRYVYQNEVRIIWTPRVEAALEPFFVDLGDLSDIAEMVTLQFSQ
ncbi:MAG: hypothetical protein KA098_04675 [Phenylobacterium sp.]|nr:hypothetical protein [Phenylobacterium sp.]